MMTKTCPFCTKTVKNYRIFRRLSSFGQNLDNSMSLSSLVKTFTQNKGERCNQYNNQLDYLSGMPRGDCGRSPHTVAIPVATAGIHAVIAC